MDAQSFLKSTTTRFDLAFLDPPYQQQIIDAVLPAVVQQMAPGGIILCETERNEQLPEQAGDYYPHQNLLLRQGEDHRLSPAGGSVIMERQQRIAVVPGSFDPITKGHMDIIRRAKPLFDKVIVLVVINAVKNPCFSLQERVELIRASVADIPGVEVDCYKGLLVDYVKQVGACAIVKGLRAVSDFEYEFQQALINKELYSGVETVFLTTSAVNQYLSSSVVKQIASLGGDIHPFVPEQVHDRIVRRLRQDEEQENQQ